MYSCSQPAGSEGGREEGPRERKREGVRHGKRVGGNSFDSMLQLLVVC